MVLIAALLITLRIFCCIDGGWKGIKPLHSNQVEVTKAFGQGTPDSDGNMWFKTFGASVRVNFTTAPCGGLSFGRGKYDVPAGTVLDYEVYLKTPIIFHPSDSKLKSFIRDTSGDVTDSVVYSNSKIGVILSGKTRNGADYIGQITYKATDDDQERFRCKK